MSWIGKIFGGGIGMMLGGPLGAILGAAIGHTLIDQQQSNRSAFSDQERKQALFFTAVFAMLGKMAKADGVVTKDELRVVEKFMTQNLQLEPRAREVAIGIFNQAKDSTNDSFEAYATQFGHVFYHEPQLRQMFYELLFTLAMADGVLHPAEERLLKLAPQLLKLPTGSFNNLHKQLVNDLSPLYAMLGLSEAATDGEVKKAYRKLANEYHPDKVIAQGLPEDFQKFAEDKFKKINEAYESIMASRT
ncbi:MAG: molecular chaperone DjlA [Desulfuromonas sp.]|nr:MAG: molecular chaperone DjlA [Desulfuromonas sp.]